MVWPSLGPRCSHGRVREQRNGDAVDGFVGFDRPHKNILWQDLCMYRAGFIDMWWGQVGLEQQKMCARKVTIAEKLGVRFEVGVWWQKQTWVENDKWSNTHYFTTNLTFNFYPYDDKNSARIGNCCGPLEASCESMAHELPFFLQYLLCFKGKCTL